MTKTTQQLAERVLKRIGWLASGETATAEDALSVKEYYSGSFAELAVEGLVYWDEADIPDEAFEALADLIAGRIAPDFGKSKPDLEQSGTLRLRRLASQGATGRVVTGEYF